jgi:hypothetical protein
MNLGIEYVSVLLRPEYLPIESRRRVCRRSRIQISASGSDTLIYIFWFSLAPP